MCKNYASENQSGIPKNSIFKIKLHREIYDINRYQYNFSNHSDEIIYCRHS